MRTALELAAKEDWDGALAVAPSGVGRDVIEWQRLRAGEGRLGEYEDFLQRRPDWPGLPLLREKGEEAVETCSTCEAIAMTTATDIRIHESALDPAQAVMNQRHPAGEPILFEVKQGQTLRIVDLEGNQAADVLFYNRHEPAEHGEPRMGLRVEAVQQHRRRAGHRPAVMPDGGRLDGVCPQAKVPAGG